MTSQVVTFDSVDSLPDLPSSAPIKRASLIGQWSPSYPAFFVSIHRLFTTAVKSEFCFRSRPRRCLCVKTPPCGNEQICFTVSLVITDGWLTFKRNVLHCLLQRIKSENKLDSLRWFSQRRSPTPYFWGLRTQGLWPSTSNSADIFVQCTYPPSFIILCLLVQKLSCWQTSTHKQTKNRRRWKHRTLLATLPHCVIIDSDKKMPLTVSVLSLQISISKIHSFGDRNWTSDSAMAERPRDACSSTVILWLEV